MKCMANDVTQNMVHIKFISMFQLRLLSMAYHKYIHTYVRACVHRFCWIAHNKYIMPVYRQLRVYIVSVCTQTHTLYLKFHTFRQYDDDLGILVSYYVLCAHYVLTDLLLSFQLSWVMTRIQRYKYRIAKTALNEKVCEILMIKLSKMLGKLQSAEKSFASLFFGVFLPAQSLLVFYIG